MTELPPRRPLPGGIAYVYMQLADDLEARIRGGEFAPGTRLPGRARLADEYEVAELTVRRAVSELQRRGVVSDVSNRGALVASAGHRQGTS
jgi:GntR family transcriptional regulator